MAGEKAILDAGMSKTGEPSQISAQTRFWIGEIAAALKREKDWRKEGQRVLEIHDGKKKDSVPFNILYSNTETWLPALYNNQPRPVVQRRFKDEDPLGKMASQAGQRGLEYALDTNSEEYSSFDDVMADVVLDALLPGRGSMRAKYDADIVGEVGKRVLKYESVCFESVKWNRWVFGYARKWKKVPWIAFEHEVTYKEACRLFTEAKAKLMTFSEGDQHEAGDKDGDESKEDGTDEEERKTALVYEIWHKDSKQVRFIAPTYKEGYLKVDEDPLGLTGFYPVPEPLRFVRKSNDQLPVSLYTMYENQAKELNRITTRINKIVEALKVRGAYDSTLGPDIEDILTKDDNTLVGAENVAGLQDGGLEKAIWLMPIDKLVNVFQQLLIARQQCKQVIYEITGISDILRGQTVASETATAQQIKNQWGTLRLKRMQREVQRYARDILRITVEIQAKKFGEKTWAAMTGLPFTTQAQVQAAQGQAAALRSQQAMGQQPQPQQVQQVQQVLSAPSWDQVLKMLRNDTQRQYRIDIETNSTVDLEATEDQKMMNETFGAISQFLQGVAPLVMSGSMPFEAAQSMLLVMVRKYRFGAEIEDQIKQMKPPKDPNEGKAQAEQQKQQAEDKRAQEAHQLEMQSKGIDMKLKEREMQLNLEAKEKEHQIRLAEMAAKAKFAEIMAQIKMKEAEAKLALVIKAGEAKVAAAHAMPKKDESTNAAT